ncbi:unnamed protein product [[Candida] boidinii]|uniref:Unnamed protein product n=1 Tax=Candida boidinii TaxID=5477 RepID=A0A9W6T0J7_CANBO|nr:hypothetical protein B5S33_g963 [[Candida] boidinii]GME70579.1 unnamed protein product [[Candida] boidinii]GMF97756.1 unnamed protein product [[Candida] boidinii]
MATKSVRKSNSETTPKSSKIKNVRSPILTRSSNIKELNSDKIQKSNAKISKELAKENLQKKVEEEEEDNGDIELPSDDESDDEDIKGLEESEDEQTSNEIKKNSSTETQGHHKIVKPINNKSSSSNSNNSSATSENKKSKRGVIYIGRIPEGFEEKEMEKYFKQFGEITRLRLSRNKKTGNSKHYGFIEFKHYEIAKIASEAMNNYLIFGHLLKCSVLSNDKINENLFNYSNKKFKIIPWNKISQFKNDKPKTIKKWELILEKQNKNLNKKQKNLIEKGINYDLSNL